MSHSQTAEQGDEKLKCPLCGSTYIINHPLEAALKAGNAIYYRSHKHRNWKHEKYEVICGDTIVNTVETENSAKILVDALRNYFIANYTPKPAVPGDGEHDTHRCTSKDCVVCNPEVWGGKKSAYWALYDIIDGWYHNATRHHLVDVDASAREMIEKVVDWHASHTTKQSIASRAGNDGELRQQILNIGLRHKVTNAYGERFIDFGACLDEIMQLFAAHATAALTDSERRELNRELERL